MKTTRVALALLTLTLAGCRVGCSDGDVHGETTKSPDGGTALIAGPFSWACTAKLDGARVAQGVPVAVKPGKHVVSCDAESMEVVVKRGEVVTVDYFGP